MTLPLQTLGESSSLPSHSPDWSVRLIQAGKLQELPYEASTWTTAIKKTRLTGQVKVDKYGVVGDEHTGNGPDLERALCCVPARHYGYWNAYFRKSLPLGIFGENLTLEGFAEEDLCIGDVLRCGSVLMQVSQPRMPCYKQARLIEEPDFVRLIMQTGKIGFLTRILEPGTLQEGDRVELVERPCPEIPFPFVLRVFQTSDHPDRALLADLPLLANEWRQRFGAPKVAREAK